MTSTARTVEFSRDATNVFFHILTRCNLRCRHCYINPAQHGAADLPLAAIDAWLALFAERTSRANVIFLGGEPTLHPDLAGAIRAARRLGYASVTVDTNGYLFHDILNQVSPEEVDFFSFSLDGPEPAVNDPIRGKGSFAHCTAGIRAARRRGFKTSLIYTVSRDNLEALGRMPALLAELGVDRFFIQVIGIRGKSAERAGNAERLQVAKTDWLAAVAPVARAVADLGITVTWPKVYLDLAEPFECAGRVAENFFIFPNGRVYRCPLCEDFALHALTIVENWLTPAGKINEADLFDLDIPEGCVMNRLIQPANIEYGPDGAPLHRIACCLLKEEIQPAGASA
ncbi:MAG: radical SAM protein [Desulfobacteraceae bacterium]|jgi:MoaA/NifB/PqqE/SkfB family radical SAM enzyme|nr:radical SAM protein [Desulfobacteraceae bacterium]